MTGLRRFAGSSKRQHSFTAAALFQLNKELPAGMVFLGTEIERRTGVCSTSLTGVIVGKFTGRNDKKVP
jgi:hypothetical protein